MNARVAHEFLLMCDVEECSVGDTGLLGYSPWVARPGVQVCIKMNDRDRTIDFIQSSENWEHNSVVTSQTII
jgi:hypothetical protein